MKPIYEDDNTRAKRILRILILLTLIFLVMVMFGGNDESEEDYNRKQQRFYRDLKDASKGNERR